MASLRRNLCAGIVAVGTAAGFSAGAWAMYLPASGTAIDGNDQFNPVGVASLKDDSVFIVEPGVAAAKLYHSRRLVDNDGKGRWRFQVLSSSLPPGAGRLMPGPGDSLIVDNGDGSFSRIHLARKGTSWKVLRVEPILVKGQRKTLGLPAGAHFSCCTTPRGDLVLGYGKLVALVNLDAGSTGAVPVKWLMGEAPADGTAAHESGQPGFCTAADAKGNVLALHAGSRMAFLIDPGGTKTLITGKDAWPIGTFLPMAVAATGGAGRSRAMPSACTKTTSGCRSPWRSATWRGSPRKSTKAASWPWNWPPPAAARASASSGARPGSPTAWPSPWPWTRAAGSRPSGPAGS